MTTTCSLDAVLSAADSLVLAARWDVAVALLRSTSVSSPHDAARVAVAVASAEVDRGFWTGSSGGDAIALARKQLDDDPTLAWELDWMELRADYSQALFGGTGTPEQAASLAATASALGAGAPTPVARGWVEFYLGLIADNLAEDRASAPPHYAESLRLATEDGDDLLASYPLRHLGDHANDAGDVAGAREQWERSTSLRQAAGFIPGALAQQLLLGVLAQEAGDKQTAKAIGAEVERWATATGVSVLVPSAQALQG
ncbi:hypothetical protein [Tenggerimyces flavus]|uniref:Uncharacterized protein n=1 Tax=Tenggerimyces flavus TaxID=1708749 RepID=A0ABV7YBK7_9ACTN|nr:hypothetical protein [Tenggerimyces flavus]MBM7786703.1 hypothetical protein [Tenggerimyces flavus]